PTAGDRVCPVQRAAARADLLGDGRLPASGEQQQWARRSALLPDRVALSRTRAGRRNGVADTRRAGPWRAGAAVGQGRGALSGQVEASPVAASACSRFIASAPEPVFARGKARGAKFGCSK